MTSKQQRFAYVGSRTTRERNARGEGISVYTVDEATGALALIQVLGNLVNPSYLALNRANTRLYAVHGDQESISAFSVDPLTGHIALLNSESTGGRNPVHLALDPSEQWVVVSNHLSSALAVLPIGPNGELLPVTQSIPLDGKPGPHRIEQPFAKPHFNAFDPSGKTVMVPDKGLDKVSVFRFEEGRLSLCSELVAREGAGPRHLAFHPLSPRVYIVNELDSTVTACSFEAGKLTAFQILSSLSDRFTSNSRAAGIAIHSNGTALYVSNRGEDSIAVFQIEPDTGRIRLIQTQPSMGKTPRFFTPSPNGRLLYALNEDSDAIKVFSIDPASGQLAATEQTTACGSPVCMVFSTLK